MVLQKVFVRTFWLFSVGIGIIVLSFLYEFFYGVGLTHPLWDRSFDWWSLARTIAFVSFVGAVISVAAGALAMKDVLYYTNQTKSRGGIDMGQMYYSQEKELRVLERMRQIVARKLDGLYARDDVLGTITLESKYQQIVKRIERLRQAKRSNIGRTITV